MWSKAILDVRGGSSLTGFKEQLNRNTICIMNTFHGLTVAYTLTKFCHQHEFTYIKLPRGCNVCGAYAVPAIASRV